MSEHLAHGEASLVSSFIKTEVARMGLTIKKHALNLCLLIACIVKTASSHNSIPIDSQSQNIR